MRRARFYLLILSLTLVPQVVAARHLVAFLRLGGDPRLQALGWTAQGLLLALNIPLAFEIARRKRKVALPPALAAFFQTSWTAWWLGSLLYALLLGFWTLGAAAVAFVQGGPSAALPAWLALAPFALSAYGTIFGARGLRRESVTVPVTNLPPQFRGLRIVQLSDLHSGRHVSAARLLRIARRAARLRPDLLVVTGDIVHNSPAFAAQAADAIGRIPSRYGTFACLGNHDFAAGADAVERALTSAGVQVLRNRGVLLERDGAGMWLCGVDDPWSDRLDLRAALLGRPAATATVLLSHQPSTWPLAQRAGVHLQLSGHTHGGQLALLWLHRSLSLARLITPFVAGLYRVGASYLYVNRGAGSVMPMVRIGARPEVTELTLVDAAGPEGVTAAALAFPGVARA
ncbi:MAG: metallophosphoesterase [Myxococcales bacterium]